MVTEGPISKTETRNAIITNFFIGYEDHGIYTWCVTFDFGGMVQGTGHYPLTEEGQDSTGLLIKGLLKVFKIDNIKKIQGQFCRVERDLHNHNSIEQIGHIMEHRWLKVRTLEYEGNK